VQDNFVYAAMNMHWDSHWFGLPQLPDNMRWHVFANTSAANGQDVWEPGQEPVLDDQGGLSVGDRSVVILVGK
jgi:isoamylase